MLPDGRPVNASYFSGVTVVNAIAHAKWPRGDEIAGTHAYCHTGEVRRIDGPAIRQHLAERRIVLLSPLGYSPTGEVFNLRACAG